MKQKPKTAGRTKEAEHWWNNILSEKNRKDILAYYYKDKANLPIDNKTIKIIYCKDPKTEPNYLFE
jgi:hypothetical protein